MTERKLGRSTKEKKEFRARAQLKARAELLISTEASIRKFVALTLGDIIAGSDARLVLAVGDVLAVETSGKTSEILGETIREKLSQQLTSAFPSLPPGLQVNRL